MNVESFDPNSIGDRAELDWNPLARFVLQSFIAMSFTLFPCGVHAVDGNIINHGIDVILLIDVSGSMSKQDGSIVQGYQKGSWDGSDQDRIRWDAVKLLLDLLDADDRILIKRFNHQCPAATSGPLMIPQVFPDGTPLSLQNDFSQGFIPCDVQSRTELGSIINRFNVRLNNRPRPRDAIPRHDDGWTLDQGGTNIIDSLISLKDAIQNAQARSSKREIRIILLTDGCDQNIDQYVKNSDLPGPDPSYRPEMDSEAIKGKIRFLLTPARIPVYTFGLNLKAAVTDDFNHKKILTSVIQEGSLIEVQTPHYQRTKSRSFLQEISTLTRGEFLEVSAASQLLPRYVSLIRDLKGLWHKKELINAGDPHASRELSIPIVSLISDFRYLAFVKDDDTGRTRPPMTVGGEWRRTGKRISGVPDPWLWRGKNKWLEIGNLPDQDAGAYSLWYGGQSKAGILTGGPFSHLDDEIRWVVPLKVDEKGIVETTQFKRVLEDFSWPPAGTLNKFYRHERVKASLAARSNLLRAADFDWELTSSSPKVELHPTSEPPHAVRFLFDAGAIVPAEWSSTTSVQTQEWRLTATGKSTGGVLDGFKRNLPSWRYEVQNELPIRFREVDANLNLSLKNRSRSITIEASFPEAIELIPMRAIFTPPAFEVGGLAKSVSFDRFEIYQIVDQQERKLAWQIQGSIAAVQFQLMRGRARLELRLKRDDDQSSHDGIPKDTEFVKGKFVVEPEATDLAKITKLSCDVALSFDRPKIGYFESADRKRTVDHLDIYPKAAQTERCSIFLSPVEDTGNGTELFLDLRPIDLADGPEPLSNREFRLLDPQGNEIPRVESKWKLKYEKNPVEIILETNVLSDRPAESQINAKLAATGPRFTLGELSLRWTFKPREVTLAVDGTQGIPELEPGQTAIFSLQGKIEGGSDCKIRVADEIRTNGLRFVNQDTTLIDADFSCPITDFDHIIVAGGGATKDPAELQINIPPDTRPGIYQSTLSFETSGIISLGDGKTSVNTAIQMRDELRLNLIVDRLIVEWKETLETKTWKRATERGGSLRIPVNPWLGSKETLQLRVRTERGATLKDEFCPRLQPSYLLLTDVLRPAAESLTVKKIDTDSTGNKPQWEIQFPKLNNRDPKLPFVGTLKLDRNGKLQKQLRLEFKLFDRNS